MMSKKHLFYEHNCKPNARNDIYLELVFFNFYKSPLGLLYLTWWPHWARWARLARCPP